MKTPQEIAQAADARAKAAMAAAMAAATRRLTGPGVPTDEQKSAADALVEDIEPAQEPPSEE